MSEKKSKKLQDKEELENQINKAVFIFNELYSAGLDFESSEKLAWGDLYKCDYYRGLYAV